MSCFPAKILDHVMVILTTGFGESLINTIVALAKD